MNTTKNIWNIGVGDTVQFWQFDAGFRVQKDTDIVIDVCETLIGGESRIYFVVRNQPDKKILCHQVEKVIERFQSQISTENLAKLAAKMETCIGIRG